MPAAGLIPADVGYCSGSELCECAIIDDAMNETAPQVPRRQFDLKLVMLVVTGLCVVFAIVRHDLRQGTTAAIVLIGGIHLICRKWYPALLDLREPARSIVERIAATIVGGMEGAILGVAAILLRALVVSRIDSVVEFFSAGAIVGLTVGLLFPRFVLRYMFPL